jgi:oxygen-independent coproporphyrinogen-3 oxidase
MPGLYIHIPYCVRKCLYCDFYSVATAPGVAAGEAAGEPRAEHPEFLAALEAELACLPRGFRPKTIFVGGGTPTELTDTDFGRLLRNIHRHVDLGGVEEWTCEANPGTLTREKAAMFLPAGINRVSLGVQSFHADTLTLLGRIHTGEEAEAGYRLLRESGLANINLDLIFGIPDTPRERTAEDAARVAALGPEHAACYCLMFEPGTPLTKLRDQGRIREVADEEAFAQYQLIRRILGGAGYHQYEISNFARPGRECRHNLLYWGDGEYLGCGPSAHSHWRGVRFANVRNVHRYCRALLDGRSPRADEEHLEPEAKARETLVMSLRQLRGVNRNDFRDRTGFDYHALGGSALLRLLELEMLEEQDGRLRLTEQGLFVSDAVFAELV